MLQFLKYASIGMLNTLIHWSIFFSFLKLFEFSQMYSNALAFIGAVSVSFILNAKITFKKELSIYKYVIFTTFMFILAILVGYGADFFVLSPIYTQIIFSLISLILGFCYSKFFVFK